MSSVREQKAPVSEQIVCVSEQIAAVSEHKVRVSELKVAVIEQIVAVSEQKVCVSEQIVAVSEQKVPVSEQIVAVSELKSRVNKRKINGLLTRNGATARKRPYVASDRDPVNSVARSVGSGCVYAPFSGSWVRWPDAVRPSLRGGFACAPA